MVIRINTLKVILNRLSVIIMLSLLAAQVSAHQQKSGLTTVLFNPRTNNIEVMHRLYLHDAEHAVKHLFDKRADIIGNTDTQAKFAQYVAQRFSLFNELDQAFTLDLVGYEVDGQHVWIYQETAKPPHVGKISVRHDVLRDIWPEQNNLINFEGKGPVQSLEFADNVKLLSVEFTPLAH